MHSKIAAIITSYKPDAGFAGRFVPLLSVCRSIVVIDNTPGGHKTFDLPDKFTIIHNQQNLGLAPALNAGISEVRRQGIKYAILFDQDSTPSPEFVSSMLLQLERAVAVNGELCCIGPTHVDDAAKTARPDSTSIQKMPPPGARWGDVTCLPTSGMTFRVDLLGGEDQFSDEFFLDLVDFEWCWRLRSRGWRFLRLSDVKMFHRLGVEERNFLGITFHVPAPYRHYFQVRDSLRLVFKPYVPTYSKLRLIGILPLKLLVYPFILDRGLERLCWMALGVRDSLRGIHGIGAASARLSK